MSASAFKLFVNSGDDYQFSNQICDVGEAKFDKDNVVILTALSESSGISFIVLSRKSVMAKYIICAPPSLV